MFCRRALSLSSRFLSMQSRLERKYELGVSLPINQTPDGKNFSKTETDGVIMKAVIAAMTHRTDNATSSLAVSQTLRRDSTTSGNSRAVRTLDSSREQVNRGCSGDVIERLETRLSSSLLDKLRKAARDRPLR
jgi:hypothetical protein